MLIKKLIFFLGSSKQNTCWVVYLSYLCWTKRVVFHTHITCNSSKTVSQNIGLQCCKSINIQNRTFELRVKTFNPFLRAHIASKTNQTSVWNLEWGKEQSCFFSSLGQNQMQLIISCRIFLVTKVTTDFFIKKITFSTSNWLWRKCHSFAFLKWPPYYGHSRTWDFFREFSSESHRILFLGQLLGVFSIGNSGLTIFQG